MHPAGFRHFALTFLCEAAMLVVLPAVGASACEGLTVSQALFQNRRDMHSLLVVGAHDSAETAEAYSRILAWSNGPAKDLNLTVRQLSVEDPSVVWSDHGLEGPPEKVPVTLLVARHNASHLSFVVDRWEPCPTDDELASLRDSPLRERIRAETAKCLAVIVHSPGRDDVIGAQTRDMLEGLARTWESERAQVIALIDFDRTAPGERIFIQFTQLNENNDQWVGVFAGRGVMLFPPLRGDAVTRANLNSLLEKLAGPCTCIENPYALGVEVPMLWTDSDEALASAAAPPLYSEQVVGGAPETSLVDSEAIATPPALAIGGIVTGVLCIVSLTVVGFAWWQYRRRLHVPMEEP